MKTRHIKHEDLNLEKQAHKVKTSAKKPAKGGARVIKTDAKGKCSITGKIRLRDREEAKSALKRAKSAAKVETENQGTSSRGECRYYPCGYCNSYHLTSWETWSPRAEQVAA